MHAFLQSPPKPARPNLNMYVANGLGFLGKDQAGKTPLALYEHLDTEFKFDHDPCPVEPKVDGLATETEWGLRNYVNPPFDNISAWYRKALNERERDPATLSVFLIPFRPHTKYFNTLILPTCSEIRFFRKKFAFQDYKNAALAVIVVVLPPLIRSVDRSICETFERDRRFAILDLCVDQKKSKALRNPKSVFDRLAPDFNLSTFMTAESAEHVMNLFDTFSPDMGVFLVSNYSPKETIRKATEYYEKTGGTVALCIPWRPEASYFNDMVMLGSAAHVLALTPTLFMDGYSTPCPTGSGILIFTRFPVYKYYNSSPPELSIIEKNFHRTMNKKNKA